MLHKPFFDPEKSYEENWEQGPFGDFAESRVYESKGEPNFNFFGHKIFTPIGIPAGPLLNGKFIKAALDKGFDIPMHKTLRTRELKSHSWPNVLSVNVEGDLTLRKAADKLVADRNYGEPLSITNSFGNPSYDPKIWQPDLADAVKYAKSGQTVTASWEGRDWDKEGHKALLADWVLGGRLIKETGVSMLEMNFSCPNEGKAALLCHDLENSVEIAKLVRKEIGDTPLCVKMSYMDPHYLREFITAISEVVDAFASINTIAAEVVDKDGKQALPGEGRLRSGVCGAAIQWAGLGMTHRIAKLREELGKKFMIIGVGGVTVADDYKKYIDVGADIVMSATGAMWNPQLAIEIKEKYS